MLIKKLIFAIAVFSFLMINIFDSWFSPSGTVSIPQNGVDADIFLHSINNKLSPIKFSFDDGVYNATLRNSFFRYHYDVTIRLQEQNAVFKFTNTNFLIILFTALLVGMFMFSGHLSSYLFWGCVLFFAIYGTNFYAVRNYLTSTLHSVLDKPVPEKVAAVDTNVSITHQSVCPACGMILTGFENLCPDCGINLTNGKSQPRESVSNLRGWQWRWNV